MQEGEGGDADSVTPPLSDGVGDVRLFKHRIAAGASAAEAAFGRGDAFVNHSVGSLQIKTFTCRLEYTLQTLKPSSKDVKSIFASASIQNSTAEKPAEMHLASSVAWIHTVRINQELAPYTHFNCKFAADGALLQRCKEEASLLP